MMKMRMAVVVGVCSVLWACAPSAPDEEDIGGHDQGGGDDVQVLDSIGEPDTLNPLDIIIPEDTGADHGTADAATQDAAASDTTVPDAAADSLEPTLYAVLPDVGSCDPGQISDYQKQIVLERLNYIRSLHGMKPVAYNSKHDAVEAACSLIIAANRKLSHTPEDNKDEWVCYSDAAQQGCSTSNIAVQWGRDPDEYSSIDIVDGFLTDGGVETLGHRRWMLDPWLAYISFGRVDKYEENGTTGAAIKVIGDAQQTDIGSDLRLVAYPFQDYPAELYESDTLMSLTVITNVEQKNQNGYGGNISFADAVISVKDPDGNAMSVSGTASDNALYGVPNNLRWFTSGIQAGVRYDVNVSNVTVNGVPKDYSWWFNLN